MTVAGSPGTRETCRPRPVNRGTHHFPTWSTRAGARLRQDRCEWEQVRGRQEHRVVFDHIYIHGETSARRLFSHQLVDEAQRLTGTHHLVLGHTTWGRA